MLDKRGNPPPITHFNREPVFLPKLAISSALQIREMVLTVHDDGSDNALDELDDRLNNSFMEQDTNGTKQAIILEGLLLADASRFFLATLAS